MNKVISKPENWSIFRKQLALEMEKVGLNSISLVIILSFFVGAVVSIQTSINMSNPLLPSYLVGLASRDSLIL
jgi:phospholipid/cholesterol/gamma-HCH transport system permease protein